MLAEEGMDRFDILNHFYFIILEDENGIYKFSLKISERNF